MNSETLKKFLFKSVSLNTKNGLFFNGIVQLVETDSLTIRDRFGNMVVVAFDNISQIYEKTNGEARA